MLLMMLQNRTPDTAVRYAGQGSLSISLHFQAIASVRIFYPIAVYTMTVEDQNAQYIFLDRRGT